MVKNRVGTKLAYQSVHNFQKVLTCVFLMAIIPSMFLPKPTVELTVPAANLRAMSSTVNNSSTNVYQATSEFKENLTKPNLRTDLMFQRKLFTF